MALQYSEHLLGSQVEDDDDSDSSSDDSDDSDY